MHKWKWVVFVTFLALAALILGLSRLARNQHVRIPAVTDAGAAPLAMGINIPDAGSEAPNGAEPREAPSAVESHTPTLPLTAPNDVVFGAVLITFEGSQGAPNKARSKAAALELAKHLLPVAQENFESAVKQGDPGSTANAGSIRRGILEPPVEYALFTLEKGAVYPLPVETPRGYWIMRRLK